MSYTPNPALDLVLERTIAVAPERVWAAWTEPELLMQWFTPAPWKTVAAELDLRPGGRCVTTMESPEGERYPNAGCYLAVEPNRLLVFTSALGEDYRPATPSNGADNMAFTARIEIEPARGKKRAGGAVGKPAFRSDARGAAIGALQIELRARP